MANKPLTKVVVVCFCISAIPLASSSGANGIGSDPDGDGNPATNVFSVSNIRGPFAPSFDAPFDIITFDPPPAAANQLISTQYKSSKGVTFSDGLYLQVCDGARHGKYDSRCVYEAPPSGKFAAIHSSAVSNALEIKFDDPICAASIAVYPVGGSEGEEFSVSLTLLNEDSVNGTLEKIENSRIGISWTNDTVRWRSNVFAFSEKASADAIRIELRSHRYLYVPRSTDAEIASRAYQSTERLRNERGKRIVRRVDFLIDDIAFLAVDDGSDKSACATLVERYPTPTE
ncbi:MAG: hypothetical protein AAF668_00590 [Pseudomonadota bacterium]